MTSRFFPRLGKLSKSVGSVFHLGVDTSIMEMKKRDSTSSHHHHHHHEHKHIEELEHEDKFSLVIGQFGWFQFVLFFILALSISCHAMQMLQNKWLTHDTPHWCARPQHLKDVIEVEAWINISAPKLPDGSFDRCNAFAINYRPVAASSMDSLRRPPEGTPTRPCEEWEYDESFFQNTVIKRWDLVCSRSLIPSYAQTLFFAGNFVGVLVSGPLADHFGRKTTYCAFVTIWVISGVVGSQVGHLYLWLISRFISGAMSLGFNNVLSVYMTELTGGAWRSKLGHWFGEAFWNFGILALAVLVYHIRDMYTLELIVGLSALPFTLGWFLMPESPRWQLVEGMTEKARKSMRRICKINKGNLKDVDDFVDNFHIDEDPQKESPFKLILDLFLFPSTRRNSILLCYCWLSFSMGYFGLIYNTPPFDWSPFLVFAFPAVVILPMCVVEPFLENTLGRKVMLTFSLLLAGGALFMTMLFPKGSPAIVVFAWAGTIICSVSFGVGYIITKDLYPTTHRTSALGTASAAARIGSIISPFIALSKSIHEVMPLLIYGLAMFLGGVLSVWIWPETKELRLPNTMDECEEFAASENEWIEMMKCGKKGEDADTKA